MQVLKKPTPWARWEEDDDCELPELPWKKVTSCAALPGLDDGNHAQAAHKAPVAASPPVMKPKSYATVAKASVVAAAPPQPAAAPKLRVAASMPSADLKPSRLPGMGRNRPVPAWRPATVPGVATVHTQGHSFRAADGALA